MEQLTLIKNKSYSYDGILYFDSAVNLLFCLGMDRFHQKHKQNVENRNLKNEWRLCTPATGTKGTKVETLSKFLAFHCKFRASWRKFGIFD